MRFKFADAQVAGLDFGADSIALAPQDTVILAVPPYAATALVPGLQAPTEFRAIVNAHFRIDPPAGLPPILGVLNAATEWIFAFPGRLSVTISAGDRLIDTPRESLARTIWDEVAGRDRTFRRAAAVANRAGAARHFRRHAGAGCAAARARHALAQSGPGRRLDRYRAPRHHRGRHPVRQPRRRAGGIDFGWVERLLRNPSAAIRRMG